jgi:hypothetical protein
MVAEPVVSRHRLPAPYRVLLAGLWLCPVGLVLAAIIIARGFTLALFDPRFVLALLLLAFPALYVWQQGVDVTRRGIITRMRWPRHYRYQQLTGWEVEQRRQGRILIIQDRQKRSVLAVHTAHLSDFPLLLQALQNNLNRLT